jgi:steroid delta-isomerase-like uncharacterized protein
MRTQFKLFAFTFIFFSIIISCSDENTDTSTEFEQQINKYVEFWNTGQFEGIQSILSEDFEIRSTPQFEPAKGIDTFKKSILNIRESYPDFHITVDEIILSSNAAAARWTIQASSPSGKKISVKGMSIVHFVDGKIKDEWISNNDLSWLKQLDYVIVPPSIDKE